MRSFFFIAAILAGSLPALAQTPPPSPTGNPLAPLNFLLGTWSAKTTGGMVGMDSSGAYTFHLDLGGHSIERSSSTDTCKGPKSFDCDHHDRLTLFNDPNALAVHHSSLLAFYMDNEDHIIYYTVSLPDRHTAVFNSQSPPDAPKFRLIYHLEGDGPKAVMSGKFQYAAPGSDEYHSYLEWTGTRQ
jgi:hypothetical protein